MLTTLLTFLLLGVVAIAVIGVVLAVVGTVLGLAMGLAGFLLFKVLPLVAIGYVVIRLLAPKQKRLSDADRKWLES